MEKILIAALKKKYQTKPIAFIKRFYYEETIPIAESFINLAIIRQQESKHKEREELTKVEEFRDNRLRSFEDINQSKHSISLAEIFVKGEDREAPKHVLIDGRAGIGKSTLCCYLANRWAAGDEEKLGTWIHQFIAVIWLPLRQLRDFSNLQTIAAFIHQVCLPSEDQKQITIQQVDKALTKLEQNHQVLYLLDGYDEVADLANEALPCSSQLTLRADLLQTLLRKEYVLLTSRPYCGATQAGEKKPDRHLENIGFIDEDIPQYVKQFFKNEFNELEKAESLLKLFEQNTTIKGIAYVPINLELICTVWKEEQQPSVPDNKVLTVTMLYQRILQLLIRRYLQERCKINTTKMLPKHYETHPRCNKMLAFLEALSWKLMEKNQLIFKPGDEDISDLIEKYFPDLQEQDAVNDDIYKHFGLLKGTGDEKTAWADQEYYIIHLTFQEFFAACYVVKHLEQEIKFICAHKYYPRYQIVWWFVAGLLSQNKDLAPLQTYFDALLGEPKTFREIDQLSLVWRCWDEAGLPKIDQAQELLKRLMTYIKNLSKCWDNTFPTRRPYEILINCLEPSLNLRQQSEIKRKITKEVVRYLKIKPYNAIYNKWLRLVKEEPEVIETVVNLLESERLAIKEGRTCDYNENVIALTIIDQLGVWRIKNAAVINLLKAWLEDENGIIRRVALRGLAALEIKDETFIPVHLLTWFKNKKGVIQQEAVLSAVKFEIEKEATVQELLDLLKSEDENVREAVIQELVKRRIKKKTFIQKLIALLRDKEGYVRAAVIDVLIGLDIKKAVFIQALWDSLRDKEWDVRRTAAMGLVKLSLSEQTWIDFLSQQSKEIWLAEQDLSTLIDPIPLRVLLRLWTEGHDEVLQSIRFKMQDYVSYWHNEQLYYYEHCFENFPLTMEQYLLITKKLQIGVSNYIEFEEKSKAKFFQYLFAVTSDTEDNEPTFFTDKMEEEEESEKMSYLKT